MYIVHARAMMYILVHILYIRNGKSLIVYYQTYCKNRLFLAQYWAETEIHFYMKTACLERKKNFDLHGP
jgi:hypothetical protein